MDFPDPVIGIAVEPKTQKDLDKLGVGLQKLAEEDWKLSVCRPMRRLARPLFPVWVSSTLISSSTVCAANSRLSATRAVPRLHIKKPSHSRLRLREVFKKQTGGRGKFADIIVRVEPVDEGFEGNLQFVDEVKGGNIPKEFIPSIQKGFTNAMKNGVLAGYPVEHLKVTVIDGSFHPVDSDQLSFELCAIQAFKKASEKAGPGLLEPIMKIEVVTPEESMGDVISDLNKRRGR